MCGMAPCEKKPLALTAFLVTFVATKVTRPPAAMSGKDYFIFRKISREIPETIASSICMSGMATLALAMTVLGAVCW